jgi:hypothetical protein
MPDPNTLAVGAINNDGGGSSSGHVRVFGITLSTGLENISVETLLQVYPNPAGRFVNIKPQTGVSTLHDISISDFSGRKMKVVRKSENPLVLDVSNFENGIYLVQLTTAKTNFTGKIVVQRD